MRKNVLTRYFLIFLTPIIFFIPLSHAQTNNAPKITYHLSWDKPNSHLFDIRITVTSLHENTTLFRIPGWRPGRYSMQNYAANIIRFEAADGSGKTLPSHKVDKLTWQVAHSGVDSVTISYQYYARQLDAGASYLDDSEAYINPVTLLMYIPGQEMLPVTLQIEKPKEWRVATSLEYDTKADAYRSENYHEIVDAPILISPDFELLEFEEKGATYQIVLQGASNYDSTKVVEDIQAIARIQSEIMRHIPFERYVFLFHLVPYRFGHGVEHKNSTSIVIGPADFDDKRFYRGFLSVTSHELFHVWNVERIRPEEIYLPDYATEQYTTTMWLYEGFTSYYGGVTLRRANLVEQDKYFEEIANSLRGLDHSYGARFTSVAEASWDSWAKGYGEAPPNLSVSFYSKGEILGMLLDLDIRHATKNKKSLDDVMRGLFATYALQNRGVPEDGLQKALAEVTGKDYSDFFGKYVYGTEEVDYGKYLGYAGLQLTKQEDETRPAVYWGMQTREDGDYLKIRTVTPESPAFRAGLDEDDLLLAVDRRKLTSENLTRLMKDYTPGDTVTVTLFRRGMLRDFEVELGDGGNIKYVIEEVEEPSKLQEKIRKDWLQEEE